MTVEVEQGTADVPAVGLVRQLGIRLDQADQWLVASEAPPDSWFAAVSRLTVDAALAREDAALRDVRERLFDAAARLMTGAGDIAQRAAGRMLATAEIADWAVVRAAPAAAAAALEPESWASRILAFIAAHPECTNSDIERDLEVSTSEVSRSGRRLARLGVVVARRVGRENRWSVTPRGRSSLAGLATHLHGAVVGTGSDGEATAVSAGPGGDVAPFLPEVAVLRAVATADSRLSVDQLVAATGLSRRDVAAAVARLTQSQYLVPHPPSRDEREDDGWVQLAVGDSPQRAVGITVQQGVVMGVLTTMTAQRASGPRHVPVDTSDPAAVAEAASTMARELLASEQVPPERVIGIGVNLPGHVDGNSGTVIFSPFLGGDRRWDNVPLARMIGERSGLKVVLENDVNALAVYAQAFGAARGLSNIAVVYIAPTGGVGAGLVVDRRLVHGHSWAAGELGHIPVPGSDRPCRCGHVGCLEASMYVSTLSDRMVANGGTAVDTYAAGSAVAHTEEEAAEDGPARRAFRAAGRDFGIGLAAVMNLVNPERLLLSGPMELMNLDGYASARAFDAGLTETFEAHGFSDLGKKEMIDRAYQSPYDAALGAGAVLLRRTVYATPQEVPQTAEAAVPWLVTEPEDESRSEQALAFMVGVGVA